MRFDTVRALVEQGTFAINSYADNTGDVSEYQGRIYSNKPPGLAILCAPPYAALLLAESILGLDRTDPHVVNVNAHVVTMVLGALPAALLVLLMYGAFRRAGLTPFAGAIGASALGAGTLLFPYSGMLMSHCLVALLLFYAWGVISAPPHRWSALAMAGVALGLALATEYLTAPVLALFALYSLRTRGLRPTILVVIGPAVAALLLGLHNLNCFGSFFTTSMTHAGDRFRGEGLLLGVLHAPDLRRVYWLTIHPYKGILYCCPVLLLPLLSFPYYVRARRMTLNGAVLLSVVLFFFTFNLCFNGWTGGWGIGPRYLIPAIPFVFVFAAPMIRRHPVITLALAALSAFIMLAVTAVDAQVRARNFGPPRDKNFVRESLQELRRGHVSQATTSILEGRASPPETMYTTSFWDSYNLGEVIGIRGRNSVLPLLLLPLLLLAPFLSWRFT